MLEQFINSITGPATPIMYANPIGYGINSIPPQATFGKFLNSLVSSFTHTQAMYGGGLPPINGGIGYGAVQAYTNAQSRFLGIDDKKLKAQALAPGAVVVDLPGSSVQQSIPPAFNPGFFAPNQLAALNPLQGSTTIQNGYGYPQGTFATPFGQGQYPIGQYGFNQGGYGKIQFLLMPLIGIFSLVKSLFGLRSFISTMQPIKGMDRNQLTYRQFQGSYDKYKEGSFDEYEPEQEHQSFSTERLQEY